VSPSYFDAQTSWNDGAISCCPQCGALLTPESLTDHEPDPAATLAAYLLAWPYVRRRLEAQIAHRRQADPAFYAYHAEQDVLQLERALNRVAELAARLNEPAMTHSQDRER
jgi:hypothetical protein